MMHYRALWTSAFLITLSAAVTIPAQAQHRSGGGGFGAGILGGLLGGAIGGAITQPRPVYEAPPPVYVVPPPVVYERRVYVAPAPVYVPPAQHIAFHPWPGPGFACYEPEPNAVNRAICASEDLSASYLAVEQALYAAIQQTPYNAGALRGEYTGFQQRTRISCSQYGYQQQVDCISNALMEQHQAFLSRLTGVFADEASRPVTVHVELQRRLHEIGLLPGVADGVYGEGTRRAISTWQSGQRLPATGVLTSDEVAMLIPGYGPAVVAPPAVIVPPAAMAPVLQVTAPVAVIPTAQPPAPAPSTPAPAVSLAAADPLGGIHESMPYAMARPKLFAAGWQTQFFSTAALSDGDRDMRQWFIDHHITEVEDCSSSGCKLQFHNADGRLLYVYTQVGSHSSDAFRGAGPSILAFCLDVDDITCPVPPAPTTPLSQQAAK